MSVEEKVFTDKLTALRYNREQSGQFFEATVPYKDEPQTLFIVAVSEHRAQLALVDYLMGLTKWSKRKQDEQYIAALEASTERQAMTLEKWMEGWAAEVEAGQSRLSREEAEKRYYKQYPDA